MNNYTFGMEKLKMITCGQAILSVRESAVQVGGVCKFSGFCRSVAQVSVSGA